MVEVDDVYAIELEDDVYAIEEEEDEGPKDGGRQIREDVSDEEGNVGNVVESSRRKIKDERRTTGGWKVKQKRRVEENAEDGGDVVPEGTGTL
jgi:hypothetical protein